MTLQAPDIAEHHPPRSAALRALARFAVEDDSGQDMVEYALLAALLGLSTIAGTANLSTNIANAFTNVANTVANSIPSDSSSSSGGNNSGGGSNGGNNNGGNNNNGGGNNNGGRHGHGGFGGFHPRH